MPQLSANQQRLISRIVLTSYAYAFCYFSILAAASAVICYYSGSITQPIIDVALLVAGLVAFRLGDNTISKLKAYRFEQGATVGSLLNETMQEVASALSVNAPMLYIFPHKDRNAVCTFTARGRWILALSDSLENADALERRSVLTHELAHRKCCHTLLILIGSALVIMLILSTYALCEAKGLAVYTSMLLTAATTALGVSSMAAFARQNEFHADAIATVLNGKAGIIDNLLVRRIPMLAAIGHDLRPDLSQESLAKHFNTSPNRLELVLAMESSLAQDRWTAGIFAKLAVLWNALLNTHPSLLQRVKNMEKYETVAAA